MVLLNQPKQRRTAGSLGQEDEMNGWIRRLDVNSRNDPTVFRSVVQSPLRPLPDNCPKPFTSTVPRAPLPVDVTPTATPT